MIALYFLIPFVVIFVYILYISTKPYEEIFVIPKGSHYSYPQLIRLFLFKTTKTFKWDVTFDSGSKYTVPQENILDINKLIGVGFFPWHHYYSVRFGWRYNPTADCIEVLSYSYVNKIRLEEVVLANCQLHETYSLELIIDKTTYTLSLKQNDKPLGRRVVIFKGHKQLLGYGLKPYFGGTQTAPQDTLIKIEYKK